jgi:hypothetical protein
MTNTTDLLCSLQDSTGGMTLTELLIANPAMARRSAQRVIAKLIETGGVNASGEGRARRYFAAPVLQSDAVQGDETDAFSASIACLLTAKTSWHTSTKPRTHANRLGTSWTFWLPTAPMKPGTCRNHSVANCTEWAEPKPWVRQRAPTAEPY